MFKTHFCLKIDVSVQINNSVYQSGHTPSKFLNSECQNL